MAASNLASVTAINPAESIGVGDRRGLFIVVEGIDGAGKSSLVQALGAALGELAPGQCTRTREPYDKHGYIRECLRTTTTPPLDMAVAFAADRIYHVASVIRPAVDAGEIVVCDRYVWSTLTYQRGIDPAVLSGLTANVYEPDVTILVDIDPELAVTRLAKRGLPLERYEKDPEFLRSARQTYLDLATQCKHSRSAYILDGDTSRAELLALTLTLLAPHLTDLEIRQGALV